MTATGLKGPWKKVIMVSANRMGTDSLCSPVERTLINRRRPRFAEAGDPPPLFQPRSSSSSISKIWTITVASITIFGVSWLPIMVAASDQQRWFNVSLPFPVPTNMVDPELPTSFLAKEITLGSSSNNQQQRSGTPLRFNSSILPNAASTCNNYRPGTVRFTQYWIPIENMQDAPWGIPAVLTGPPEKDLIECGTGRTFGKTSKIFWEACHVQGTCFTRKKVLLNLMGTECFRAVDRKRFPFGVGSRSNPLVPFVSVAVNDLPFGTYIFIKDLYGKLVPGTNGLLHNGCVRVDDTGWGVDPCHVDFFALTYFRWKPQNWGTRARAFVVPSCKVGKYVDGPM